MKSSLLLLALTASAVMGHQVCQPGSLFKDDCNLCTCSFDGRSVACTDMKCIEGVSRSQKYCEPGKQFKMDECNTCTCSLDGSTALCTLQHCAPVVKKLSADKYCTPNSVFRLDNCNTCKCSEDGIKAFCTLASCPEDKPSISNLPNTICKPHSQFNDYCNTCSCAADGMSYACTRMFCDKDLWNKDGSLKVLAKSENKQVCQPLSQFNDYCNTCSCAADGMSFACTKMYCDEAIWNKDGSLKVLAKSENNQVCQPLSQFNDYCNTCSCATDGMSFACTRMYCDPAIWNKDGSLKVLAKSENKQVCQPLSQFNDYCNTCSCASDGMSFACTRMYCDPAIWNKDGSLKVLAKSEKKQVCQPLSQFNDYCNTCSCAADGMSFACTRMYCDEAIWNKDGSLKALAKSENKQLCQPLSQFKDYCNTCSCAADGMSFTCTRMMCDKEIWNQDGSLKLVAKSQKNQICEPRSKFNDYCNTCFCNDDGSSFTCTRIMCDKDIWNKDGSMKILAKSENKQVCQPLSQFNDYCNTCSCAADGMSFACTRMHCDKDLWNKDGSLKITVKLQKNQVCKPRTQFNNYCNSCTCNDDGSSYACTRMFCDKNIWNKDGSLKLSQA